MDDPYCEKVMELSPMPFLYTVSLSALGYCWSPKKEQLLASANDENGCSEGGHRVFFILPIEMFLFLLKECRTVVLQ